MTPGQVLALAALRVAQAAPTDAAEREDALFGAPPAAETAAAMETALGARDDTLAIGGHAYLRLDYFTNESGDADNFLLASPSLMDVYLDARPSERLRLFTGARLTYDPTLAPSAAEPMSERDFILGVSEADEPTEVVLDQLWLKLDIERVLFVTIGRQPLRWGSGRFWNPTDVLNRQRRDPLALFDVRTGLDLVKVHLPLEAAGANLYAVGNLAEADRTRELGGALRAEWVLGQTELVLLVADREDAPLVLGGDVSSGVGLFDVRLEAAASRGVTQPYFTSNRVSLADLAAPGALVGLTRSRRHQWIAQITAGADVTVRYSDADTFTLGVEYFYNDAGYASARVYPVLAASNELVPLYVGRHYAAGYVLVPSPGSWNDTTFTVSTLCNLSDASALSRLDYQVLVLTHLRVSAYVAYHYGRNGELHYGLADPALEPLRIYAPRLDAGLGLRMAF